MKQSSTWFHRFSLILVYTFLYAPVLVLMVYSFNDSNLVSSWGGFTFRWYPAFFADAALIRALLFSLSIAISSATASMILGTLAACAIYNYSKFPGRGFFMSLLRSPMVMPEVIIAISLLFMLVSVQNIVGFPSKGFTTILIGHALIGMAYAAVVVQARLGELNPSIIEAAYDLGCPPRKAFFLITLPMIYPAMLSAWLLTFTLSLDDVVISAFLSGPGSTPLPVLIYGRAVRGLNPIINVLGTLTVVIVSMVLIFSSWYLARRQTRVNRETAAAMRT